MPFQDGPKHGKDFSKQGGGHGKPGKSVYLTQELCKFHLTGFCDRGANCNYSHETKEFPCKYLHGTGICQKAEKCAFKHDLLNEVEIQKFMVENEDFLLKTLKETGRTNLSDYFTSYLAAKERKEQAAKVPKDVMIPQALIKAPTAQVAEPSQPGQRQQQAHQ